MHEFYLDFSSIHEKFLSNFCEMIHVSLITLTGASVLVFSLNVNLITITIKACNNAIKRSQHGIRLLRRFF